MKSEMHLFIIWSNAMYLKDKILLDIKERFEIKGLHEIQWEKKNFSKNLTRFYGENLPKNSNKEKECGNKKFLLVVVEDKTPLYKERITSKGVKIVNVNMYDSKEMYRNWTGGGHKIHGTNTIEEFKHDIVMLTGISQTDYLKYIKNGIFTKKFSKMPGEDYWNSIEELIYVMNETLKYVVLRNFDGIFSKENRGIHSDIDILTNNYKDAKLIINSKSDKISKKRVRNIIKLKDDIVYMDIRYLGDKYYCRNWENDILENRYKTNMLYYRTSEENFKYSLLYHALIHKVKISEDYLEKFKEYFPDVFENNTDYIKGLNDKLQKYLIEKSYCMEEPKDYSVYFNSKITNKKMSINKLIMKSLHKLMPNQF